MRRVGALTGRRLMHLKSNSTAYEMVGVSPELGAYAIDAGINGDMN